MKIHGHVYATEYIFHLLVTKSKMLIYKFYHTPVRMHKSSKDRSKSRRKKEHLCIFNGSVKNEVFGKLQSFGKLFMLSLNLYVCVSLNAMPDLFSRTCRTLTMINYFAKKCFAVLLSWKHFTVLFM